MTVAAERPGCYWWCLTHESADGHCGRIGEHYVIPLDHLGPPSKEERKEVLREIRERAK